jgi:hypothetical protein
MNTRQTILMVLIVMGTLIFGLTSLSAISKEETAMSGWAAAAPAIDGQADDWAGVPRGLDKSTRVEYAFRNDAENLYGLCVFKDPKFLSTIKATGLIVYFDTSGKREKERGIRFIQKTVGADELLATLEKQGQVLTEERKQESRAQSSYFLFDCSVVDGQGNILGPAVGTGASLPPVFRLGRSGQEMVYEFRVPLGKRQDHPAGIGTAPGQSLQVEFEWGGLTKEMRQAMASQVGERGSKAMESGEAPIVLSRIESGPNFLSPSSQRYWARRQSWPVSRTRK